MTALALILATPALAQTVVTPDVGAARGLGTTAVQTAGLVTIDGGTLAGSNLFHSFTQFSLGAGDTARWVRAGGGAAGVTNIINRVTGGQVSQIAGAMDSTALPNASFYFINPAGIVFAAGAQVNVPAAAYFSTAGELHFAGGARFAVATPNGSTLSVAAPESFGFVGGQGAIVADGLGKSFTAASTALSLAAADVRLTGVDLALGRLDVMAVGPGAAAVALADPLAAAGAGAAEIRNSQIVVQPNGGAGGALRLGGETVTLDASTLVSFTDSATRGGDVIIAGNHLRMINNARLGASSQSSGAGGAIRISAGDFDGETGILFSAASGSGAGGDLSITADSLILRGVSLSASTIGAGAGGRIALSARTLLMDGAFAISQTQGAGRDGDITIAAPSLTLTNAIASTTSNGTGAPGSVILSGDHIAITGGVFGSSPGLTGDSGNLTLTATSDLTASGTTFTAATNSAGVAGAISITAPRVAISTTFIDSAAFGLGSVGSVTIDAGALTFDNSQIIADSRGAFANRVGLVQFHATGDIALTNSSVTSNAYGRANGGVVSLDGRNVRLEASSLQSDTFGDGAGGQVSVKGDSLVIHGGTVSSNSFVAGGGGDVTLDARAMTLEAAAAVSSDTYGPGKGGGVTLKGGAVTLAGGSAVTSKSNGGSGAGGLVTVASDSLALGDSSISSNTFGQGNAGAVFITTAGAVTLAGKGLGDTFISSDTLGDGKAGGVSVVAGAMSVQGNAKALTYISSDSAGRGDAGQVSVTAKTLEVIGGGFISSDAENRGHAGNLVIQADALSLRTGGGLLTDTFGSGAAGDISIKAGTVTVDGGGIDSEALRGSTGAAGTIGITADSLTVKAGGLISTVSNNPNLAGRIDVTAGAILIDGAGSAISSENQAGNTALGNRARQSGGAGAIHLASSGITVSNGGRISTNAFAGAAGDIEIAMPAKTLLVLQGAESPGSIQTSSGAGTGGRISVSGPLAIVSNGGSVLALGQQRGANVLLQSRYFIDSTDRINTVAVDGDFRIVAGEYDVSAGTVSRDLSVLDASKVLRGQCPAARSSGQVSQLITRPVGPFVREPSFASARDLDHLDLRVGTCG